VVASLGHVAEGVLTAPVVLARARRLGVEMPITEMVYKVLYENLPPRDGVVSLMTRETKPEI